MTATAETAKDAPSASAAPADGQLVTVRNRVWVVSQVAAGTLAGSDGTTLTGRVPHVVTLGTRPIAATSSSAGREAIPPRSGSPAPLSPSWSATARSRY